MYEDARIRDISPTLDIDFAHVVLPEDWQGRTTIHVQDDEDMDYQLMVHPGVQDALRRACLLMPHNLCTRISLGVVDTGDEGVGLQIVRVYWEVSPPSAVRSSRSGFSCPGRTQFRHPRHTTRAENRANMDL